MEVELDRLDLRYATLRVRSPERDRRLLASLSDIGQLAPIVVVPADEGADRLVLVDGYKRVRALHRLRRDVARAIQWELSEVDALLLRRSLSMGGGETSLEQAWLLEELRLRFGLTLADLARRFDRSASWVSRRLGLVRELPSAAQDLVREGKIVAHAAAKHLVPLARANSEHCERLAKNIAPHRLSSREVGELYSAWRDAAPAARLRIVDAPQLYLQTRAELSRRSPEVRGSRTALLDDLSAIAAISRRAWRRVREGALLALSEGERQEVEAAVIAVRSQLSRLFDELADDPGGDDARSGDEDDGLGVEPEGDVDPGDRQGAFDLARSGAGGPPLGERGGPPDRAGGDGGPLP